MSQTTDLVSFPDINDNSSILEPAEEVINVDDKSLLNQTHTESNLTITSFGNSESNLFAPDNFTSETIHVPIVGYEISEERAKFTVYKLCVQHKISGSSWFVYRRYTDFVRLASVIKTTHPQVAFLLPKKRWFGNNFETEFLNERLSALQRFVNKILNSDELLSLDYVKEFFCLNNSPIEAEKFGENGINEVPSTTTISVLENILKEKSLRITELENHILNQQNFIDETIDFIKNYTNNCEKCSQNILKYKSLDKVFQIFRKDCDSSISTNENEEGS